MSFLTQRVVGIFILINLFVECDLPTPSPVKKKSSDKEKLAEQNDEVIKGEKLYKINCTSCHMVNKRITGPALANATSKYSEEWLYKWTTYSESLLKNGDTTATRIFEENNKLLQPSFENLSRTQVKYIYKYIDWIKNKPTPSVLP
jgi:hypothetical protein